MYIPVFKVRVDCITYNHAPFIVDALNGFCMQETDFPFVCTIVDDASTDGAQDIINNYLQKYFAIEDRGEIKETDDFRQVFAQHNTNPNCFFRVLFLKYNHYQVKKRKQRYFDEFGNVKYIAKCEGEDYWTDRLKLQTQVDFLENNPEFTMTCHRTQLYSVRQQRMIGENYCYNKSGQLNPKDVIYRGGLFISTCSIIFRRYVKDNIPAYWEKCKVGDYPLQIACVMRGKAYYFDRPMSVYRVENMNSWMGSQKMRQLDSNRLEVIQSQIDMFRGFSEDYPYYSKYFKNKIAHQINSNIPKNGSSQDVISYRHYFSKEMKAFSIIQKFDSMIMALRIPKLPGLYNKLFNARFKYHQVKY